MLLRPAVQVPYIAAYKLYQVATKQVAENALPRSQHGVDLDAVILRGKQPSSTSRIGNNFYTFSMSQCIESLRNQSLTMSRIPLLSDQIVEHVTQVLQVSKMKQEQKIVYCV